MNGITIDVAGDITLAAALLNAGFIGVSHVGQRRAEGARLWDGHLLRVPRVTIDGTPGRRACLEPVREGMAVDLDD